MGLDKEKPGFVVQVTKESKLHDFLVGLEGGTSEALTALLINSDEKFWHALRDELARKGIDPKGCDLNELHPTGAELEFGVLGTPSGQTYQFDFHFSEIDGTGQIVRWENYVDSDDE